MKTARIELPHDKKVNLVSLAREMRDTTNAKFKVLREPSTQTLVDQDNQERVQYLGYMLEVPAEIEADVLALLDVHTPDLDDKEEAEQKRLGEEADRAKVVLREALKDKQFLTELREALGHDGEAGRGGGKSAIKT